ncbi:MAG TPA: hypothetical protein VML75_26255 [Kofleriaceae bacterium]|nr:hypothetical protein [Kofleriaceae bacterium]
MSAENDDRPDGAYSYVRRPKQGQPKEPARSPDEKRSPVSADRKMDEAFPLPPPKPVAAPPPMDLDAAALTLAAPGRLIDLETPPEPVDESERMPSIDLLDLSGPLPGAGVDSPSFAEIGPEPLAGDEDEPGWTPEVAEVPQAPTPFERAALHADRTAGIKVFLPPAPEPWWKRRLPHMILGSILLLIGSYVYGCTKVMGDSIAFRRALPEAGIELRNLNSKWETVTPAKVERAVRNVAKKHDMKVSRVELLAEEIGQIELPGAGCRPANWPDTIMKLDGVDQLNLTKAGKVCAIPGYILTIRAHVSERWGLFKHGSDEVAYVLLNRYEPYDEPPALGPGE